MKNIKVSIVMPTYNSSDFVSRAIESILLQTHTNWELLITDDCSSDDTLSILKNYSYRDQRIKVFQLSVNQGGGIARNNSIEQATGRYIAFCDSDDVWISTKLEQQLAFMKEKNCLLSFTSYTKVNKEGKVVGEVKALPTVSYYHEIIDDALGCSTVMYDTSKYGKVYFSSIRKRQDWAFKLRVLSKTRIAYGMPDKLVKYMVRTGSVSSNKFDLVKYNIAIYKEELGMPKVLAYIVFACIFMPYYMYKKLIKRA